MNQSSKKRNEMVPKVPLAYRLDTQAQKTLKELSKSSLREAVDADSKIFRNHKLVTR